MKNIGRTVLCAMVLSVSGSIVAAPTDEERAQIHKKMKRFRLWDVEIDHQPEDRADIRLYNTEGAAQMSSEELKELWWRYWHEEDRIWGEEIRESFAKQEER